MDFLTPTELNELRRKGGYTRKPTRWNEVGSVIPMSVLNKLKLYRAEELGISDSVAAKFRFETSDFIFLVSHNGGLYLVNTEGYDYARYIRLIGPVEVFLSLRSESETGA